MAPLLFICCALFIYNYIISQFLFRILATLAQSIYLSIYVYVCACICSICYTRCVCGLCAANLCDIILAWLPSILYIVRYGI